MTYATLPTLSRVITLRGCGAWSRPVRPSPAPYAVRQSRSSTFLSMSGQDEVHEWLRSHYNPKTDGPVAKRVRFSDIREELESNFPRETFSDRSVSDAIKTVFPVLHKASLSENRDTSIYLDWKRRQTRPVLRTTGRCFYAGYTILKRG